MVLVQFAVDEEGQYLGTTKNTPASMHNTMRNLWKGLVDDGLITQVMITEYCESFAIKRPLSRIFSIFLSSENIHLCRGKP